MLPESQSASAQLCDNRSRSGSKSSINSGDSNVSSGSNNNNKPSPSKTKGKGESGGSGKALGVKSRYRIVVMGAAGVGKSAIISQFLYDKFQHEYQQTVEELHQGEYDYNGVKLTLDILDTAGAYDFPAMRQLAIATSDAFVLVYSVEDEASFQAVTELREQILREKAAQRGLDGKDPAPEQEPDPEVDVPIVIVGNKVDIGDERRILGRATAESIVCVEWGNGYVEASAKDNVNIVGIFKEILRQSKVQYALSPAVRRRRQSTPAALSNQKSRSKAARQTRSERSSCS